MYGTERVSMAAETANRGGLRRPAGIVRFSELARYIKSGLRCVG
jgi:hypothetical protein